MPVTECGLFKVKGGHRPVISRLSFLHGISEGYFLLTPKWQSRGHVQLNQISGDEKKWLLVCGLLPWRWGKESELAGLWREAVTLQLHVPLQPVNAGFVEKDSVNQP